MTADFLVTPALGLVLAALAVADLRTHRLPDRLTLPLIAAGLLVSALRSGGWPLDALAGAVLGGAVFAALGEAAFRLRGAEALGLGDAKLLAAAGAWLGWRPLPTLVLAAALAALAVVAVQRLAGRGRTREIAFGPYLAAAFYGLWCWYLARGGA